MKNIIKAFSLSIVVFILLSMGCSGGSNGSGGSGGVTLQSITISPAFVTLPSQFAIQYTATGIYSDNSTKNITQTVTWASSNNNYATISNATGTKGLATTISAGKVTISASLGAVTSTTNSTITVTSATLSSISITPANNSIPISITSQLTATGIYSDNTTQNLTSLVSWSSSNSAIATVSNTAGSNGLITPVAVGGPINITASFNNVSATTTLSVNNATLVSIAISSPTGSFTMSVGNPVQLTALGTYTNGVQYPITSSVAWNSSNSSVATVGNSTGSQGLVTPISPGTTTITVTPPGGINSVSSSFSVTVTVVSGAPQTLTITQFPTTSNLTIAVNSTLQFKAYATFTGSSTQVDVTNSVNWGAMVNGSSSTYANISNVSGTQGLVTGISPGGPTQITATLSGVSSNSLALTVSGATLISIAVTPATPSIYVNGTQQFIATGTYSDKSQQVITSSVNWISNSTSIASINATNGLATGVSNGTSIITATDPNTGISGNTMLTVINVTVNSITISPTSTTLTAINSTFQFGATTNNSDGSHTNITSYPNVWTSLNTGIASIGASTGLALAVNNGTTTIQITYGGQTANASITVNAPNAYVTDFGSGGSNGILWSCPITTTGALSTCNNIAHGFTNPKNIIYDSSSGTLFFSDLNNLWQCTLSGSCNTVIAPSYNSGYANGLIFNPGLALVGGSGLAYNCGTSSSFITACTNFQNIPNNLNGITAALNGYAGNSYYIPSSSGLYEFSSNFSTNTLTTLNGVTGSGNYGVPYIGTPVPTISYIPDLNYSQIYICSTPTNPPNYNTFTGCTIQSVTPALGTPTSITIYNSATAYIVNAGFNAGIFSCTVLGNGSLSNCNRSTGFTTPTGIAVH